MKKIISTLLFISIALLVNAYDFMVDGVCFNYNNDGTSVTVTYQNTSSPRYSNLSGSLTIPSSVTYSGSTYDVTSIGSSAFYGCTSLTSATIPNSVTSIGDAAFYKCNSLKTAIIGENVTSIGSGAFKDCSLLENLVALRERPIVIPSNTFDGVPTASCDLHVKQGSKIRYENQDVWKDFLIIVEDAEDWADVGGVSSGSGIYGDVNGDGHVNSADVTAVYDVILGNE